MVGSGVPSGLGFRHSVVRFGDGESLLGLGLGLGLGLRHQGFFAFSLISHSLTPLLHVKDRVRIKIRIKIKIKIRISERVVL